MQISLRWLNQLSPIGTDTDLIVETLTMAGLEVENTIDLGMKSGLIVVAKVISFEKHPDADRLNVVKADIGAAEPARIVCGAQNLRDGMYVPCALPGAKLPGDITIKRSKIRGVESAGMLCSAKELGLGNESAGIMDLPDTYIVGEPFDFILDIKVTPNRADCLSLVGVARDLSAMLGKKKTYTTTFRFPETLGQTTDQFVTIDVRERMHCPRYTCRYIKTVKPGPSPLWLSTALATSGIRSINNIVDVTNYVMLEMGLPLHAFDFASISGAKIIVRFAEKGETLVTLDDRTIELHPEDLVIADAEKPIALAGVMGGKNSQVTSNTVNVILECAYFDPKLIRKTARRHGFQTDSSYRFERGVDRQRIPSALARATQLIGETAQGTAVRGFHDVQTTLSDEHPITLNLSRMHDLLGLRPSNVEVADRLTNLGFEIRRSDRDSLQVIPPSFRVDIHEEVDLIEEAARVCGYDKIPETMPGIIPRRHRPLSEPWRETRKIQEILAGLGLSETIHYSFISAEESTRHGYDHEAQPKLANPLTEDQGVMRPALLPGLLRAVNLNQRQQAEGIALFEVGKTFQPGAKAGNENEEGLGLAIAIEGDIPSNWTTIAGESRSYDFFDLKGMIEALGERLGLGTMRVESPAEAAVPGANIYHPGRSAVISWNAKRVGIFGELSPTMHSACDLRGRVCAAEIDLQAILAMLGESAPKFTALPKFPASERDLAVIVENTTSAQELIQVAVKLGRPLIEEVEVVDLYTGAHVPDGKKSIALRLRLRSGEATMTDEEISAITARILGGLQEQCGAELRS